MKNHNFVFIFVSLFGSLAHAQINLDKPVMIGSGDQIYESGSAPGWYYFFPKELCRTSVPSINQQGTRLFADFWVSLCDVQIDQVKAELVANGIKDPKVRVFRGLSATTSAMSLQDIYSDYDPKIETLGDAGDFSGITPYRLSLYSGSRRRSIRNAEEIMSTLFGSDSVDAFVQIQFYFTSVLAGLPRESTSAVSVYIGRGPMDGTPFKEGKFLNFMESAFIHEPKNARTEEDRDTHCWQKPTPGMICLK